jgi:hypothetical protein
VIIARISQTKWASIHKASMKIQGIVGAALMAAGGMCPLVRLPIIGNWNYFDLDVTIASVFYVVVLLAFVGSFMEKAKLVRICGWLGVILVLVTLAGVYFKSHDAFSFIHFKKAVNFAAGVVKYKWGWFVILAGALVLITVRGPKKVFSPATAGSI